MSEDCVHTNNLGPFGCFRKLKSKSKKQVDEEKLFDIGYTDIYIYIYRKKVENYNMLLHLLNPKTYARYVFSWVVKIFTFCFYRILLHFYVKTLPYTKGVFKRISRTIILTPQSCLNICAPLLSFPPFLSRWQWLAKHLKRKNKMK